MLLDRSVINDMETTPRKGEKGEETEDGTNEGQINSDQNQTPGGIMKRPGSETNTTYLEDILGSYPRRKRKRSVLRTPTPNLNERLQDAKSSATKSNAGLSQTKLYVDEDNMIKLSMTEGGQSDLSTQGESPEVTPAPFKQTLQDHMKDILNLDVLKHEQGIKQREVVSLSAFLKDDDVTHYSILRVHEKKIQKCDLDTKDLLKIMWKKELDMYFSCPCSGPGHGGCTYRFRCSPKIWGAMFMTDNRKQCAIECLPTSSELWQGPWLDWNVLKLKGVQRDTKRNLARHVKWHILQEWDTHYAMSKTLSILNAERARATKAVGEGASEYFKKQCAKFVTVEHNITDSWDDIDTLTTTRNERPRRTRTRTMPTTGLPWKVWFLHALTAYRQGLLDSEGKGLFEKCMEFCDVNVPADKCDLCGKQTVPRTSRETTKANERQLCGGRACNKAICVECMVGMDFSAGCHANKVGLTTNAWECPYCKKKDQFQTLCLPPIDGRDNLRMLSTNMLTMKTVMNKTSSEAQTMMQTVDTKRKIMMSEEHKKNLGLRNEYEKAENEWVQYVDNLMSIIEDFKTRYAHIETSYKTRIADIIRHYGNMPFTDEDRGALQNSIHAKRDLDVLANTFEKRYERADREARGDYNH